MTPLRQRYVDDLRLRNKSPRTIETYVLRVAQFAKHFGRSPEQLGGEQLRAYQQHLIARQVSWSTFNQTVCALRFLYNVTLGRTDVIQHLPFAKRPRILPCVLSPQEVQRLLDAACPRCWKGWPWPDRCRCAYRARRLPRRARHDHHRRS